MTKTTKTIKTNPTNPSAKNQVFTTFLLQDFGQEVEMVLNHHAKFHAEKKFPA